MKNVLVTGANRGIGLAHARGYAARGAQVYATARDLAAAAELRDLAADAGGRVTLLPYDARDPGAPAALKSALAGAPLDLLLANAGVIGARSSIETVEREDVIETFAVNAVAPLMLVQALADNVAASQRKLIAVQSSLMGSIEDNGSGGYYAYRMSKVALNMAARSMARDLAARAIIAVALHPGWVKTRMGGGGAKLETDACAAAQAKLFDALKPNQSGLFFNYDGKQLPW
jgi:NAD(P)-dependent dehydrogenase (short-subunit alcohol dehydrogenase family)